MPPDPPDDGDLSRWPQMRPQPTPITPSEPSGIEDRRPAPSWCLVAMPDIDLERWSAPVRVLALTEDCVEAAKQRGWTVLAKDSDMG